MAKVIGDTYIAIVLDGSGSMAATMDKTIVGVNEIIDLMRAQKKKLQGKVKVSLIVFRNQEGDVIYFNDDAAVAKHLDVKNYIPSGSTPLRDGVGQAIKLIDGVITDDDAALIYIFTDGEENSSSIYNWDEIKGMISDRENNGNWTFVYQGVKGLDESSKLSIGMGNAFQYDNSAVGITTAHNATTRGINAYFASRSKGDLQVSNFYDPDKTDPKLRKGK